MVEFVFYYYGNQNQTSCENIGDVPDFRVFRRF